ncbi:glycosyl hydrolase family 95 catalytic domain-containing protein [Subtercola sp. RTI3]|uniref:glycosyl hydrolase family 95 catalytic domain-containing protein n=1 Tax=Subtercola sp. RTI3 TaxID=3048639 RepID=UPI002B2305FE|nr:glycoside hydrolase N-terminal domain-containing protein [Subtercola sp. RTI3]MEA9984257.1 glycoside hydrolase N-terminal domain-containing protein [Subtercola sp. RTI3]
MTDPMGPQGFTSTTQAHSWADGVVAGSGTVGAVVYGTPERHTITFAHEEFFLPANLRSPAPNMTPRLGELREALFAGDSTTASAVMLEAAEESGDPGELIWTDPLVPCASVSWSPDAAGAAEQYLRTVDYTTGEATVAWGERGSRQSIATLALRSTSRVVITIRSERAATGILSISNQNVVEPSGVGVGAVDYLSLVSSAAGATNDALWLDLRAPGREPGTAVGALTTVRFSSPGSVVTAAGDEGAVRLTVDPEHPLVIVVDIRPYPLTGRELPPVLADVSPGPGTAEEAQKMQRERHGSLMAASSFLLGRIEENTVHGTATSEQLWAAVRAEDAPVGAVNAIIEAAFAAGRHTIISSTGRLPPTLQGVWQGTWTPAWSADYTLNGNVQNGAIAALASTGNPELLLPFFDLIGSFTHDYVDNAARLYAAEGYLINARVTTHGHANHFVADYPHLFWVGAGGWALRFAFDYFSTTGDVAFLREWAWPFAQKVLRFYETALVERDGALHIVPSYSPENIPGDHTSPLAVDATCDIAIIRDAVAVGLEIGRVLDDDRFSVGWSALRNSLPPYRVAPDGALAEWIDPHYPDRLEHRHSSQLYPLWYRVDDAFDTPELKEAARRTIERKLAWRMADPTAPPGRMEMAFGLVQLGLAASALGESELALTCVVLLARDHWKSNMVSTHDAGVIFNVDASGGLPAVVASMIIRSQPGTLGLLPALPASWNTGEVRGFTGRGGIRIDRLAWTPSGAEFVLSTAPGSAASRTSEVLLVQTVVDAVIDSSELLEQVSPREFRLDLSSGRASGHLRW